MTKEQWLITIKRVRVSTREEALRQFVQQQRNYRVKNCTAS